MISSLDQSTVDDKDCVMEDLITDNRYLVSTYYSVYQMLDGLVQSFAFITLTWSNIFVFLSAVIIISFVLF